MEINLAEIYDSMADSYDKHRNLFNMDKILSSFDKTITAQSGHLLDLGCGAGEPFSKYFSDKGWMVTGVDISEKMLALAEKYVPGIKTIHGDMSQVTLGDGEFDAVTAIYSLFHVPKSQHLTMFKKIKNWLKPGGKALFTYAGKAYTGSDEFDGIKEFMGQQLYYSHHNNEQLNQYLNEAGLIPLASDHREIGGETFLWMTVSRD